MFFVYFLEDFELFSFASIIIRVIFVLTFYLIFIYTVRSSYVTFIFAYFLITIVSAKFVISIIHMLFLYNG